MSNITINIFPEDSKTLPVSFHTACSYDEQETNTVELSESEFYQLVFILEGSGSLYHNEKTYRLRKGCAFFTSPGTECWYTNDGGLATAFLTVQGNALPGLMSHYGIKGGFFFYDSIDFEKFLIKIDQIIREYYDYKRDAVLSSLTFSFCVDFFEQQANAVSSPDLLLLYIEKNFTKKLTIDELAKVNESSVSKLCHDFKRKYNCTVFDHILDLRLTFAREYMRFTPNAKTKEAATLSGFDDVSYFCKAYKKKFGRTPSEDKER